MSPSLGHVGGRLFGERRPDGRHQLGIRVEQWSPRLTDSPAQLPDGRSGDVVATTGLALSLEEPDVDQFGPLNTEAQGGVHQCAVRAFRDVQRRAEFHQLPPAVADFVDASPQRSPARGCRRGPA